MPLRDLLKSIRTFYGSKGTIFFTESTSESFPITIIEAYAGEKNDKCLGLGNLFVFNDGTVISIADLIRNP